MSTLDQFAEKAAVRQDQRGRNPSAQYALEPQDLTAFSPLENPVLAGLRAGGVIPVFAYLVVPPVAAILLTRSTAGVVIGALLLSVVGSFFGIYFSVRFDFPAGASISSA